MARSGSRQGWKQVAAIAAAVAVLVAGIYVFMEWQRNQPGTPVRELKVGVTSAGQTLEIEPYTVCELDAECAGGEPPRMTLDERTVTFEVPEDVTAAGWRLLLIYDDPAANSERVFASNESSSQEAEAVTESGARLVVGEVSALEIDKDDAGEETPVIATWSVGFE